ncbi:hypothetical protein Slala04_14530 [Streptomyces lavendulae subsp. lavendulae]|nr:hypothetical protein Slala04_14530 [Streptomyces lavendulae subsp. lavendulae]
MFVNAAPITTATARSTTLPRIRKALKPASTLSFFSLIAEPFYTGAEHGANGSESYGSPGAVCPIGRHFEVN